MPRNDLKQHGTTRTCRGSSNCKRSCGVRYVGAFPIRLRAVRNDGAGHRLEGSERYFAFPVIGLPEDRRVLLQGQMSSGIKVLVGEFLILAKSGLLVFLVPCGYARSDCSPLVHLITTVLRIARPVVLRSVVASPFSSTFSF